ncbi:hypothetical protein [Chitinimonas sp.]|uniref:hypothetical protein n=1 Tax=Chitinimonas sp. TaxID=1934313 RepID=UPI002F94B0F6
MSKPKLGLGAADLRHAPLFYLALGCLVLSANVSAKGTLAASATPKVCDTPTTPFCDALMPPIAGWNGHVFRLSQTYPIQLNSDAQPWLQYNPTTQPGEYLQAALAYFYEGNLRNDVEESFDPKKNKVRNWYNAPWQDYGLNGREFVHGLTRERVSRPKELAPQQTSMWNNYAVGFYNAPGGYTIGKIWADHGKPNADLGNMPEGTLAAKLLFTTAPVSEVPYLQGSPEWKAYLFKDVNNPNPKPTSPRGIVTVRLLQIDIAVKDSRVANLTGWVFGTFVYGGGPNGPAGSGWTNVKPVGVMWGNDPGYSGSGPLQETWLNADVKMPHVGYQGRLNGPVDNPVSSCLSCHATAEMPPGTMIPPNGQDPSPWFQNIKSGTPFNAGRKPLDYSLQLQVGLQNFLSAVQPAKAATTLKALGMKKPPTHPLAVPARDGGS